MLPAVAWSVISGAQHLGLNALWRHRVNAPLPAGSLQAQPTLPLGEAPRASLAERAERQALVVAELLPLLPAHWQADCRDVRCGDFGGRGNRMRSQKSEGRRGIDPNEDGLAFMNIAP